MTSLRTGSSETGFSVDARNRFLSQLKPVPVHSVDRPLVLTLIGERREPHTYRTAEKNLRHIYIYVFYIYIYIYIRSYVVHVPFTRALRANVGPAG